MIDLGPVFRGETSLAEVTAGLGRDDLRAMTNEMIDLQAAALEGITDADVTFVPVDPAAKEDDAASSATEVELAWTLAHVVAHTTASSEEGAATALTLARGVVVEGRSRYETPWETFSTVEQVLARLDESRRMRLSMLDAWPDQPHLDVTYTPIPPLGPLNPITRFVLGLGHDHAHLGQLREIAAQVRRARAS